MVLTSGLYEIRSRLDGTFIGRANVEDLSLLPKRIVTVPREEGFEESSPKWQVEEIDGGYYLKTHGSEPTLKHDDKVVAPLLEGEPGVKWQLVPVPRDGSDTYTIRTEDGYEGWVVPSEEPYTQIEVRSLAGGPGGLYPPREVFIFKRVEAE